MVKYVEGKFDESYTHTLGLSLSRSLSYSHDTTQCAKKTRFAGVNYMEKRIQIGDASINFSIWDLGGGNSCGMNGEGGRGVNASVSSSKP
jgi:hypothetical protein